jgi:hypothetical protein
LQALPGEFSNTKWYAWANILWNILDLSMSGYVTSDGRLWSKDAYGYLSSASPVDSNRTRAFGFDGDEGDLLNGYDRDDVRPCLSLVK